MDYPKWTLRQQFIFVTAMCVIACLAGIYIRMRWYKAELSRLGGEILYSRGVVLEPPRQRGLSLEGEKCDDATIQRALEVADCLLIPHHTLIITDTSISDDGIDVICEKWSDVQVLVIVGGNISERAVARLKQLSNLGHLDVNGKIFGPSSLSADRTIQSQLQ